MSGPSETIRILGIDPGSQITGWGLIGLRGQELSCLDYGVVRAPAKAPLPERLTALHAGMKEILARVDPGEVAVEELYVARNVRSTLTLGHARGVILLACAERGLPLSEYPVNTVRQSVLGQGGTAATKERVAFMVKAILGLEDAPEPFDITDALACAICHAHKRSVPA